jgi:hypothetical protein
MVIQAPAADVEVTCGGAPMLPLGGPAASGASKMPMGDSSATNPGTLIGKRYVNAAGDLELLCTRPGAGALAVGGAALTVKGAKPLPSSD